MTEVRANPTRMEIEDEDPIKPEMDRT
ncbi:hypothetical protein A2U01_0111435, partial [Trifolium medium]|nr:hypothetical protein [Trifolium medium]